MIHGLVDPGAAVAPHHAQQPAVMHPVQQRGAGVEGVGGAPALHAAVVEHLLHVARMGGAARAHEGQHLGGAARGLGVPRLLRGARMQQRQQAARYEAVVDQAILLHGEAGVAALQIARAVVLHAVAQCQVLRPRRGADRVGLDEAEALDGLLQRGRGKQRAGDGVAAQRVQRDGFGSAHGVRILHGRVAH
jgi:hypothetical protein